MGEERRCSSSSASLQTLGGPSRPSCSCSSTRPMWTSFTRGSETRDSVPACLPHFSGCAHGFRKWQAVDPRCLGVQEIYRVLREILLLHLPERGEHKQVPLHQK